MKDTVMLTAEQISRNLMKKDIAQFSYVHATQ